MSRTQHAEEDFVEIEFEIMNGGNTHSIAQAMMLPHVASFLEDYGMQDRASKVLFPI